MVVVLGCQKACGLGVGRGGGVCWAWGVIRSLWTDDNQNVRANAPHMPIYTHVYTYIYTYPLYTHRYIYIYNISNI